MTDPLAMTLHEHHSRFIPPLGRVTGDQLIRKLIIVIRRPHSYSGAILQEPGVTGVQELQNGKLGETKQRIERIKEEPPANVEIADSF
jgi:hypothetical protein